MNLKAAPNPSAPKKTDAKIETSPSAEQPAANTTQELILGIAATIIALAALGIQIWTMQS